MRPRFERTIPALAGKTPNKFRQEYICDEPSPRSRENQDLKRNIYSETEPSPRLRGTRQHQRADRRHDRTIPALAGNTLVAMSTHTSNTNHPRARGEHLQYSLVEPWKIEPSPRSRGTHVVEEHPVASFQPSPRSRGTLCQTQVADDVFQTIPALAGNTLRSSPIHRCRANHPRARGEHWPTYAYSYGDNEPSPRSRGTLAHELDAVQLVREPSPRSRGTLQYLLICCPVFRDILWCIQTVREIDRLCRHSHCAHARVGF